MTYTTARLMVSRRAYDEIVAALKKAGYSEQAPGHMDMSGIMLERAPWRECMDPHCYNDAPHEEHR